MNEAEMEIRLNTPEKRIKRLCLKVDELRRENHRLSAENSLLRSNIDYYRHMIDEIMHILPKHDSQHAPEQNYQQKSINAGNSIQSGGTDPAKNVLDAIDPDGCEHGTPWHEWCVQCAPSNNSPELPETSTRSDSENNRVDGENAAQSRRCVHGIEGGCRWCFECLKEEPW